MGLVPVKRIGGVALVRGVQGADVPLLFIVVRREKRDFNDDF
jgi:hypothetical protein